MNRVDVNRIAEKQVDKETHFKSSPPKKEQN